MTREEAHNEGIKVLTRAEAIDFVAEELSESLFSDQGAIWNIIRKGHGGTENMTNEELEDFFECWDDVYILEWNLEEQQ